MEISDLKHVSRPLPNGGQVVVLNTGAIITPEDCAMLQALYSRSPAGIGEHLEKLAKSGSGKFMETFYLGYGHNSIGDCGCTYIFIEGVSMLAAKAIQDWSLYSGQECSTRYLDFSTQPFVDPLGTEKSKQMLEKWREFYVIHLEETKKHVALQFPRDEGEDEKTYTKAVNARAFDIMRAFLPAGASTSLSWTTNLRQAKDKLLELRHHPLQEVKDVAEALENALIEAYPNSFPAKRYLKTEEYYAKWMNGKYYFWTPKPEKFPTDAELVESVLSSSKLYEYADLLKSRPPHTELPKRLEEIGYWRFQFLLDFGSYRDLQRHRAITQSMPFLYTAHGFEPWYLAQLSEDSLHHAQMILPIFEHWWQGALEDGMSSPELQYYVPMGYRVPCELMGGLPSMVYLIELRSSSTVHPTLRKQAQLMAREIEERIGGYDIVLHVDNSEIGRFDIKRGQQDIVEK